MVASFVGSLGRRTAAFPIDSASRFFSVLRQHAMHRTQRARVAAFLEQRRMRLRRREDP
jgi:hypothetical protein